MAEYRNKSTGFVFQSFCLEPSYSVLENVVMPLTIAGIRRREREERGREVLIKLGLGDKIYKKANELSGGQKQRVSIARALVRNPDVILADEPTGNLDSQNGAEVMTLFKDIVAMGKSVILVTHNADDARNAENVIRIKDGVVSADYMERYDVEKMVP